MEVTSMRIRHFVNGEEQAELLNVKTDGKPGSIARRYPIEDIHVGAGHVLTVECTYNTTTIDVAVVQPVLPRYAQYQPCPEGGIARYPP